MTDDASPRQAAPRRFGQSLFVAFIGLAAGGAGSLLVSAVSSARSESPRAAPAGVESSREFVVERAAEPRAPLLANVPTRVEAPAATAATERPSERDSAAESEQENARRHLERHERAIRQHEGDPRDQSWAPAAEAHFTTDLQQIGGAGGFELKKLSCKTTSCVADVEWTNFGAAVTGYTKILHGDYAVNCAKRIVLPDPSDPAAPYAASAVFDCVEARARDLGAH